MIARRRFVRIRSVSNLRYLCDHFNCTQDGLWISSQTKSVHLILVQPVQCTKPPFIFCIFLHNVLYFIHYACVFFSVLCLLNILEILFNCWQHSKWNIVLRRKNERNSLIAHHVFCWIHGNAVTHGTFYLFVERKCLYSPYNLLVLKANFHKKHSVFFLVRAPSGERKGKYSIEFKFTFPKRRRRQRQRPIEREKKLSLIAFGTAPVEENVQC